MSEKRCRDALTEAKKLDKLSEDDLVEQLGFRIEDIKNIGGYGRSRNFSIEPSFQTLKFLEEIRDRLRTIPSYQGTSFRPI